MNIIRKPAVPEMGNFFATLAIAGKELFTPKSGRIIETPGTPAALNMTIVGVLAAAVVGVVILKKRRVI